MKDITILDGGMGRQLKRMGAPFRQPEWSALAMFEAPDYVGRAHRDFIAAGADVIETNSYALVPFHIGEARFASDGARLAALAGRLARDAADAAGRPVQVAGSLPPLFGSYRPDLFDAARAPELLDILVHALDPFVDLWLAETLGAIAEAEAAVRATAGTGKPVWLSFTLDDGHAPGTAPVLRSGEAVADAVARAIELGAAAILFNCSQPEFMGAGLDVARAIRTRLKAAPRLGVYANAFPPQRKDATANETLLDIRPDLDPAGYLSFARDWAARGADIIGGCCGIGPEHIAALHAARRDEK